MIERVLIACSLLAFVTLFVISIVLVVSPHGATAPGMLLGLLSAAMVWVCLRLAFGEREHPRRRARTELRSEPTQRPAGAVRGARRAPRGARPAGTPASHKRRTTRPRPTGPAATAA